MSHFIKIIFIALISGLSSQSFALNNTAQDSADHRNAVLFDKEQQQRHYEKMKGMSEEEKKQYRNTQYEILRKKALLIGFLMPATPPWSALEKSKSKSKSKKIERITDRHQKQLAEYRKKVDEQRQFMQERLEQQQKSVKERIAKLVAKNTIKPSEAQPPKIPRYQPLYPLPNRYAPPVGPMYPRFYRIPPPTPYNY